MSPSRITVASKFVFRVNLCRRVFEKPPTRASLCPSRRFLKNETAQISRNTNAEPTVIPRGHLSDRIMYVIFRRSFYDLVEHTSVFWDFLAKPRVFFNIGLVQNLVITSLVISSTICWLQEALSLNFENVWFIFSKCVIVLSNDCTVPYIELREETLRHFFLRKNTFKYFIKL